MKYFFNGKNYEMPDIECSYTILNRILVEKEDDEKVPFFAFDNEKLKLIIIFGKEIKE